jgi:toxin ParE1/3/4
VTTILRTARAEEDLIQIWSHIAIEDERAADRVLDAIDRKIRLLGRHPMLGRKREDIGGGVRSLISGSYLILYRLSQGGSMWFGACMFGET